MFFSNPTLACKAWTPSKHSSGHENMKGFDFLHKRQKQTWQGRKYGQGQRRTEHTEAFITHVDVQVEEKYQGSIS